MAEMVRKSSVDEVVNHWILAGSCLLLMLTGFAFLFHLDPVAGVFGGWNPMKEVHNWGGVVFCLSLLYSMRHYLKDAFEYDADDWQWFKVAGGYLSHKVKVPPMGKYNPGQKLYYLAIVGAGIAIALSGFGMWLLKEDSTILLLSHLIHNIAFIVFVLAVPVHIYLGTLANPGTLQIMLTGKMPLKDAKKKHPKWINQVG
ncbi:MAG: formate dehydrogenase subunit gamma [Deltaproteobacteria bacterium]|jgi:formate dehydrogenase subunit gamma|nr:MAG: formate dehydrogenase subunit gamma [Deltaproteobacteria bacterium]HSL38805.1 formate dehydrogenase subunit gamma [Desulforhopalus sp.]